MPSVEIRLAVVKRLVRCQLPLILGLLLALVAPVQSQADEIWVTSIMTSDQWAYSHCTDYWITVACGMAKDYSDPGLLPRVVSVGDVVKFRDRTGKLIEYTVRHINFFVFDKDVNTPWGSAKKGDTTCTLYTVRFRADTSDSKYPSRLIVNGCQLAH